MWIGNPVELDYRMLERRVPEECFAVVVQARTAHYTMAVCRDGQIRLSIPQFEQEGGLVPTTNWDQLAVRAAAYLQVLNAFQLLLACSIVEKQQYGISLTEVTIHDIASVTEDGSVGAGGLAVYRAMPRFTRRHAPLTIDMLQDFTTRPTIEKSTVELALDRLSAAFEQGTTSQLSSLAKSVSELQAGNNDLCIVLAWFVCEELVSDQWRKFVDQRGRIDGKRAKELLNYNIATVMNVLELTGQLPHDLWEQLRDVRVARNIVAHQGDRRSGTRTTQAGPLRAGMQMAGKAVTSACELLQHCTGGVRLQPPLHVSMGI